MLWDFCSIDTWIHQNSSCLEITQNSNTALWMTVDLGCLIPTLILRDTVIILLPFLLQAIWTPRVKLLKLKQKWCLLLKPLKSCGENCHDFGEEQEMFVFQHFLLIFLMEINAREEQGGHCPMHFSGDDRRLNWAQERVQDIYIGKTPGANFVGIVLWHGNGNNSKNHSIALIQTKIIYPSNLVELA